MEAILIQREMSETSGKVSEEIVLAKKSLELVARSGRFIYFLKTIEDEMKRKARAQFELILWILKVIRKCQTKVSQIKQMTQNLKNLTKIFYLKKCAMSKNIENHRGQITMKIALVKRSKNLAKEVGKSVKKAALEAAFRSSWAAPRKVREDGREDDHDLEYYSMTRAESWWDLLDKCVKLADARILSVERSLKIMEKKERWEKLLKNLFLHAAMAAQLGKTLQKKYIVMKNMDIIKIVNIYQRRQEENVCPKVIEECGLRTYQASELKQNSFVLLSEISSESEMEK